MNINFDGLSFDQSSRSCLLRMKDQRFVTTGKEGGHVKRRDLAIRSVLCCTTNKKHEISVGFYVYQGSPAAVLLMPPQRGAPHLHNSRKTDITFREIQLRMPLIGLHTIAKRLKDQTNVQIAIRGSVEYNMRNQGSIGLDHFPKSRVNVAPICERCHNDVVFDERSEKSSESGQLTLERTEEFPTVLCTLRRLTSDGRALNITSAPAQLHLRDCPSRAYLAQGCAEVGSVLSSEDGILRKRTNRSLDKDTCSKSLYRKIQATTLALNRICLILLRTSSLFLHMSPLARKPGRSSFPFISDGDLHHLRLPSFSFCFIFLKDPPSRKFSENVPLI
uniref:Uncharacterized protein n=2 Tax=Steinernema glaseri TaxID=37863 RepID=A0A1I8AW09_9BILA